ncbi:MAG: TetR/AcrR family transcriptional regulator [Acidimicrobiales bacterium]
MAASTMRGAPAELLRDLVNELIDRPPPEVDGFLDAAATCFARHGFAHTSVPDIARQLGVSPATVYRQIGPVNGSARLVLARDAHRLTDHLASLLDEVTGPEAVVQMTVTVARFIDEHPLTRKVLADEPQLTGQLLRFVPDAVRALTTILRRYVGEVAPFADHEVVADLVMRLVVMAVLAPPSDLEAHIRAVLGPHLTSST